MALTSAKPCKYYHSVLFRNVRDIWCQSGEGRFSICHWPFKIYSEPAPGYVPTHIIPSTDTVVLYYTNDFNVAEYVNERANRKGFPQTVYISNIKFYFNLWDLHVLTGKYLHLVLWGSFCCIINPNKSVSLPFTLRSSSRKKSRRYTERCCKEPIVIVSLHVSNWSESSRQENLTSYRVNRKEILSGTLNGGKMTINGNFFIECFAAL